LSWIALLYAAVTNLRRLKGIVPTSEGCGWERLFSSLLDSNCCYLHKKGKQTGDY
jgi:hypothetical protein